MADHCIKSALCRKYNMPGGERKHAYLLQVQITCCLELFILPISETKFTSNELEKNVSKLLLDINEIFPYINELVINSSLYAQELKRTVSFISQNFPKNINIECINLFAKSKYLVDELINDLTYFWNQHPTLKAKEHWQKIKEEINEIIENLMNIEKHNNNQENIGDEFDDCFDDLLEFLWPRKIEQTKRQNLFLVNDRIWVVAYTRKDVREIVKKEFGLVDVKMCGIPHGEVMENGMSEREMINLAQGSCMVIGRTE